MSESRSSDFPILFRIKGRLCLVVGAGPVGLRKARTLLSAGARVRLIDPVATVEPDPDLEFHFREFRPDDLAGAALAFAATGDRETNAAVAREARARGIPVNVVDLPDAGDFTLPAVWREGDLTVSVGTGGASPALAVLVRDRLSGALGEGWGTMTSLAGALRRKGLTPPGDPAYNFEVLRLLFSGGLAEMVAAGDADGVDRLLTGRLGQEYSLAELGVEIPKGKR